MPAKKYIVRLTNEERERLAELVRKGRTAAYRIRHANVLLKADVDGPAWPDQRIAEAFGCHRVTVEKIRTRFVMQGLEAALERKKRQTPPCPPILDGEGEARLIALSRTKPPQGHARWTMRLLAQKMVELQIGETISHTTVWETLKKTNSSRTCASAG
jgi:transposase